MLIYPGGFKWLGTNEGDLADIGDAIAAWVYKRDLWDDTDVKIYSEMMYRLINTKDIFKTHVEHLTNRMLEYYGYRWKLNPTMHPKYIPNGEPYQGTIHNKLEIINRKLSHHGWMVNIENMDNDTQIPVPKLKWVRNIGSVVDPMTITGQQDAILEGRSILSRMRKKHIENTHLVS